MRSMRVLAIAAIAGLLAAGVILDLGDRPAPERAAQPASALAAPTGAVNTWFCPGGSGPAGVAELTVQMVNGSDEARAVTVSVLPGGAALPGGSADGLSGVAAGVATVEIDLEPRGRVLLQPSEAVGGAPWVGVVVETRGAGVVVEQILSAAQGGVGRSPCLTETAASWVVSNGATRAAVERERFVVMLLNPFPDVAVADIELVADVGRDSIDGLVVPAQRVVAVDVTEEVTVASTVAAFVDVVSGRVAASWIQIADGPLAGRGARTAPAVVGAAAQWHLPVAAVGPNRADVVAVSNPSAVDDAEVDLEIIAEDPEVRVSPIEITVRPGRTALVDLSRQARLDGIGPFSVAVRSLTGMPVAASITSVTAAPTDADDGDAEVAGSTATTGADGAAHRWLVPAEAPAPDGSAEPDRDSGALMIVNPSPDGIALVDVSVDGSLVREVEIGPLRMRRLPLASLGAGSFVAEVRSSSPVVVGRETVGLTSRSASLGVAVEQPVLFAG